MRTFWANKFFPSQKICTKEQYGKAKIDDKFLNKNLSDLKKQCSDVKVFHVGVCPFNRVQDQISIPNHLLLFHCIIISFALYNYFPNKTVRVFVHCCNSHWFTKFSGWY